MWSATVHSAKWVCDVSSCEQISPSIMSTFSSVRTGLGISFYCKWWKLFLRPPTQYFKWRQLFWSAINLNNLRKKNIGRLILAHININSIRYKFDQLVYSVKGIVDVLMITETKLDDSLLTMQFNIEGYYTFRLDWNEYGCGILLYVQDEIPSKFTLMKNSIIEGFFIELNLREKRWLLYSTYNSNCSFISDHLNTVGNNKDLLLANYEKIFLMGDLNVEGHNGFLEELCDLYNLKTLIKVPTCFKNPESPTSIDVMLTTSYRSFHNSCAIERGLSDFHKMIVTVMKSHFQKKEPKIIQYRDYNIFSAEEYCQHTLSLLSSWELTRSGFDTFMTKCKDAFDIRAPIKHEYLRSTRVLLRIKRFQKL